MTAGPGGAGHRRERGGQRGRADRLRWRLRRPSAWWHGDALPRLAGRGSGRAGRYGSGFT